MTINSCSSYILEHIYDVFTPLSGVGRFPTIGCVNEVFVNKGGRRPQVYEYGINTPNDFF
jgi:hypothetical protein